MSGLNSGRRSWIRARNVLEEPPDSQAEGPGSLAAEPPSSSATNLREAIERSGFVVVPGLLSVEEVSRLRSAVASHMATGERVQALLGGVTQPNAAVELPELSWLFSHPQVVSAFKATIGSDTVVFTGHCDAHLDTLSAWHKDSGEAGPSGSYFAGGTPFALGTCRVLKMGIYLQPMRPGQGLNVRVGSHLSASLTAGDVSRLASAAGDAVIFDVRLTHSGEQMSRLMALAAPAVARARLGRHLHRVRAGTARLRGRPGRAAVFFTYGADDEWTHSFSVSNMLRQLDQVPGTSTSLPDTLAASLHRMGVKVASSYSDWPAA